MKKEKKYQTGDRILFKWSYRDGEVPGTILDVNPGGRYGNNYIVKSDMQVLAFGKFSTELSIKKSDIIKPLKKRSGRNAKKTTTDGGGLPAGNQKILGNDSNT